MSSPSRSLQLEPARLHEQLSRLGLASPWRIQQRPWQTQVSSVPQRISLPLRDSVMPVRPCCKRRLDLCSANGGRATECKEVVVTLLYLLEFDLVLRNYTPMLGEHFSCRDGEEQISQK